MEYTRYIPIICSSLPPVSQVRHQSKHSDGFNLQKRLWNLFQGVRNDALMNISPNTIDYNTLASKPGQVSFDEDV